MALLETRLREALAVPSHEEARKLKRTNEELHTLVEEFESEITALAAENDRLAELAAAAAEEVEAANDRADRFEEALLEAELAARKTRQLDPEERAELEILRLNVAGFDAERAHEEELLQLTDAPMVRLRAEVSQLRMAVQTAALEQTELERKHGIELERLGETLEDRNEAVAAATAAFDTAKIAHDAANARVGVVERQLVEASAAEQAAVQAAEQASTQAATVEEAIGRIAELEVELEASRAEMDVGRRAAAETAAAAAKKVAAEEAAAAVERERVAAEEVAAQAEADKLASEAAAAAEEKSAAPCFFSVVQEFLPGEAADWWGWLADEKRRKVVGRYRAKGFVNHTFLPTGTTGPIHSLWESSEQIEVGQPLRAVNLAAPPGLLPML